MSLRLNHLSSMSHFTLSYFFSADVYPWPLAFGLSRTLHFAVGTARRTRTICFNRVKPHTIPAAPFQHCLDIGVDHLTIDTYYWVTINVKVFGTNKLSTLHFSPPWSNSLDCTNSLSPSPSQYRFFKYSVSTTTTVQFTLIFTHVPHTRSVLSCTRNIVHL